MASAGSRLRNHQFQSNIAADSKNMGNLLEIWLVMTSAICCAASNIRDATLPRYHWTQLDLDLGMYVVLYGLSRNRNHDLSHLVLCVHSGKDPDVETILQFAARLESTFELKQWKVLFQSIRQKQTVRKVSTQKPRSLRKLDLGMHNRSYSQILNVGIRE